MMAEKPQKYSCPELSVRKTGVPRHHAQSALNQVVRAGQRNASGVDGQLHILFPLRDFQEVLADDLLVALERIGIGDHGVGHVLNAPDAAVFRVDNLCDVFKGLFADVAVFQLHHGGQHVRLVKDGVDQVFRPFGVDGADALDILQRLPANRPVIQARHRQGSRQTKRQNPQAARLSLLVVSHCLSSALRPAHRGFPRRIVPSLSPILRAAGRAVKRGFQGRKTAAAAAAFFPAFRPFFGETNGFGLPSADCPFPGVNT